MLHIWVNTPTCLQCSVNIALVELSLCQYEEVVSLSPSPSIISETTACRQNFFFQQTSQSRGGLQIKQTRICCQHKSNNSPSNRDDFWNCYTLKNLGKGTSLVVQGKRVRALNTGRPGLLPGRGTKISHTATKPTNPNYWACALHHNADPARPK